MFSKKNGQEGTEKTSTTFVGSETKIDIPFPTHKIREIRMDAAKPWQYPGSFKIFIQ